MSRSIYCVGNNLAVLVGAFNLARAGRNVKQFTDGGVLGGYFAGISIEGYDFDFGAFLFEQFKNEKNDNMMPRSTINSWLDNGNEISSWLNSYVELKRAVTPQTYIFGKKFPDYIMSNRLDVLLSKNVKIPPMPLDQESKYHASHKENGELYNDISYMNAAKYNHGEEFHKTFIEPYIMKILAHSSDEFLAKYHRFSWAPLYYPETLIDIIKNQKLSMPEYPFWTTPNGFIGELVKNIKKELKNLTNIEIIDKKLTSMKITEGELVIDSERFVEFEGGIALGLSMNRAHELLGSSKKLDGIGVHFTIAIALVHCDIIKDNSGCVFIVDDEFASYRVTNQDAIAGLNPEWHRVVIESNSDILKKKYNNLSLEDAICKDLKLYFKINDEKKVKILKTLSIENGLYLPTKEFISLKKSLSIDILNITENNTILTGDLLDYGTSSINNQIRQGLKIGEKYEK